jgi:hypothetical protein
MSSSFFYADSAREVYPHHHRLCDTRTRPVCSLTEKGNTNPVTEYCGVYLAEQGAFNHEAVYEAD